MKKSNLYLRFLFAIVVMAFISCQTEDNLQPEGQWELSTPLLLSPADGTTIVLDETTPNETVTFTWEPAASSAGYSVTYEVLIDEVGTDFEEPLFIAASANSGTETSFTITFESLNQVLAFGGFPPNTESQVSFAIRANSLSRSTITTAQLTLVPFESEIIPQSLFISGSATETGEDISQAIALRRLTNSDGILSNVHEVYTSLTAGETYKFFSERSLPALEYGGSDGTLELFGDAIVAQNSGQFRIKVDLDANTYELLEIDFWSMVGTPINGGWDGDEPLDYQGAGVWSASINLLETGGFAFRANENWDYLLKRVVGTANTLILESDAANQGLSVEDIPNELVGTYRVILDLSAENYNYSFEQEDIETQPLDTPTELFLLENGTMIEEFVLNGDTFSSNRFIPLQASNTYSLNTSMDGSGTSYSVNVDLANGSNPDGDVVSESVPLFENANTFNVSSDRALRFSIDFSAPFLNWTYYNFKLFHWQEWELREEIPMSYVHPNTYVVTADLVAGYESKFISPWDFDLGSDDPTSLIGNLINAGGANLINISNDGTYTATMILEDTYQSGTYEFVQ